MIKQLRAVIFENGQNRANTYANDLFEQLAERSGIEAHVVNVYDKRPCTQLLPVRTIPNVAVLLFADTLEDGQQIVDVVKQIDNVKRQETINEIVDELIALTPEIPDMLQEKIIDTYYGGGAV